MIDRRRFIAGLGAGLGAGAAALTAPTGLWAQSGRFPLVMPPLLDATETGRIDLTAIAGKVRFGGGDESDTWGFNRPFLGPTLRVNNKGETAATVKNTLPEEVSVHWHGLIIPGDVDGGPHQPIAPGETWAPVLPVDQRPATLWYHSHIHGKTAPQVYKGLAGVMQLTDGLDKDRGLPTEYGVDDLTLVLQDRRFDSRGRMVYDPAMRDAMMGFSGNVLLVNGQYQPFTTVPRGIVRLRILNGSNARIYSLAMDDGRDLHLIGTDSGLLDRPMALKTVVVAPAERVELLVDFGTGGNATLVSAPEINSEGGGMMGGMNGGSGRPPIDQPVDPATAFPVLPFSVDESRPAFIDRLPDTLGGELASVTTPVDVTRHLTLDMRMGPSMMLGGGNRFSISGEPFDMGVINQSVKLGATERWLVTGQMLMHPFHVHGCAFQVVAENGGPVRPQNLGWKDTVLVNGDAEILVRFDRPAARDIPFMYHCHILEHEDGGMMGQFTVG